MYDLATYLNEMCLDNSYPLGVGIKLYLGNFPSKKEVRMIIGFYLELLHKHNGSELSLQHYVSDKIDGLEGELMRCMLLNNYFCGVWSMIMLRESDICNDLAFNYYYAAQRARLDRHIRKEF